MTIDDQIRDKKLHYDINAEAVKVSALSSGKTDKYEYLSVSKILPSNQKQIIKQAKFTYSPLGKAFEKQTKTIEDQGKKQIHVLNTLKPKELEAIKDTKSDDEKSLKYNEIFDKLSSKRTGEIYNMSKEINFIYYYKNSNLAPVNFIDFKGPMHMYNIKNGETSMEEDKKNQIRTKGNSNGKSKI